MKLPIKMNGQVTKKIPMSKIAELGKVALEMKHDEYRHQNEMESKKYDHQCDIDKANGIAEYRNRAEGLTDSEKETLTRGFVQILVRK